MCTLSVSNVNYHKFSHGAAFYMLNGKNVNVMLEYSRRVSGLCTGLPLTNLHLSNIQGSLKTRHCLVCWYPYRNTPVEGHPNHQKPENRPYRVSKFKIGAYVFNKRNKSFWKKNINEYENS